MDRLQNRPEEMEVDIPVVPRGEPIKGPLTSVNALLSRWAMYLACVCLAGLLAVVVYGIERAYHGPWGRMMRAIRDNYIAAGSMGKNVTERQLQLFVLCSVPLFHFAHRFRYTLYDGLQIKHLNEVVFACCYGVAIVGTIAAGYLLWTL